ncbi:HEAT repeat domain-containing protein [Xenorhabdus lircayensis]|uniref:HEAT repeat domain-containing protein n=1 Tax=Xenorhabdus lircayensis TaxID=2763499 RepID=A0ABS0U6V9_9GAMM|nr:HEAT repeat domain-containing protein [Xenorhabdus lircayensis]MBI6549367.1 HEAT repeat domain-containing protein [Xenorhabdus lircayensis]
MPKNIFNKSELNNIGTYNSQSTSMLPLIKGFVELQEAVDKVMSGNNPDFLNIAPILSSLKQEDIIEILNDILEKREITSNYKGVSEDHMYLHRQTNFNLLIRLIGNGRCNTLCTNESDIFVINPTNTEIIIPCYQFDLQQNIFQKPKPIKRVNDYIFKPNEVYYFEYYKYILDFDFESSPNNFVLIIHSETKEWITWVYDKKTLEPIESICIDLQVSRLQLYVRLLGEMKASQAIQCIENLAISDYANFVRWEAVQSLSKIAPSNCLKILKILAENDQDPMLRQAAIHSLEMTIAKNC